MATDPAIYNLNCTNSYEDNASHISQLCRQSACRFFYDDSVLEPTAKTFLRIGSKETINLDNGVSILLIGLTYRARNTGFGILGSRAERLFDGLFGGIEEALLLG